MKKFDTLTVAQAPLQAVFSADFGFTGTLSAMEISWTPGTIRLIGIPMSINPSRQGTLQLSMMATGATAATLTFLQATSFTAVTINTFTATANASTTPVLKFFACQKTSSSLIQKNVNGAFVIEGSMELTFQDYTNTSDGSDQQNNMNGSQSNSITNTNSSQSNSAAYNKWDF